MRFCDRRNDNLDCQNPEVEGHDATLSPHTVSAHTDEKGMPSEAEDYRTLGLERGADASAIKKSYLRLVVKHHPDKGGTAENFRRVFEAYKRLITRGERGASQPRSSRAHDSARRESQSRDDDEGDDDDYEWEYDNSWHYEWFRDFFRRTRDKKTSYQDFFDRFRTKEAQQTERARQRAEAKKRGVDWMGRDKKAKAGDETCHACKQQTGINAKQAAKHGLVFREYRAHPFSRVTCWGCKTSHKSVMTQNMAMKTSWKADGGKGERLGKVLDGHHEVFRQLRREKKTFHHQPVTDDIETRNSEYFWVADLQQHAERFEPLQRKRKVPSTPPVSPPRKKHAPQAPKTPVKREPPPDVKQEQQKPLWETHKSPEGYTYYYNTTTGETQWDMPDDFPGVAPP